MLVTSEAMAEPMRAGGLFRLEGVTMTKGALILSKPLPRELWRFREVMREIKRDNPDGWPSCDGERLHLDEMAEDGSMWYIHTEPINREGRKDWKRQGWAKMIVCKRRGKLRLQVYDGIKADEGYYTSLVGRTSLEHFATAVLTELQPTPASKADSATGDGMTMDEAIELEEAARLGDKDAAKRLDDEAQRIGFASWADWKEDIAERWAQIAKGLRDNFERDPVTKAIIARLEQPEIQNDPVLRTLLGYSDHVPILELREKILANMSKPVFIPASNEQERKEQAEDVFTAEYLAGLRRKIVEYFDDSDLRDLCFDMGIDYADLPGQSKKDKARELVDRCKRTSRVPDLVAQLQTLRPKVSWKYYAELLPPPLTAPSAALSNGQDNTGANDGRPASFRGTQMIPRKTLIDQVTFKGSVEEFDAVVRDCGVEIHNKLLESDVSAIPPVGYEKPPRPGVVMVSLANPDGPEGDIEDEIAGILIASPEPGKRARLDIYCYEGTTGCEKAWELLKAELVRRGWIGTQPAATLPSAALGDGQGELASGLYSTLTTA